MKTSERFNQALKEFLEIQERGGLAQDTTIKQHTETALYLAGRLYKIGREDGMRDEDINSILEATYLKPAEKQLESKTLLEEIGAILHGIKEDSQGRISQDQIPADLPHDARVARNMIKEVHMKFMACTEKERRTITRSDPEFLYLMMRAISKRCGFDTLLEAFGIDETTINIPRIKRGNELFWCELGDPEPELTEEDIMFQNKMSSLMSTIIKRLHKLYPDLYNMLKDKYHGTLTINTSHKENADKLRELNDKEFKIFATPQLIDALVMRYLVTKEFFVNTQTSEHTK
jgi:hypothetical protein